MTIPVSSGDHHIEITESETGAGWNDILYFQQNTGLPIGSNDYCFTLNGVGDTRALENQSEGELHVGIFDSCISDNWGTITLAIDDVEYLIDIADVSVEFDGWIEDFEVVEIPHAGTYIISLASSTTSVGWNDILYFQQNHGLPTGSNDYCFTLNGVEDFRLLEFESEGELHVGILDSFIGDNAGDICVHVGCLSDPTAGVESISAVAWQPPRLELGGRNPVSGPCQLGFALSEREDVELSIYDVLGRRIEVLHEGPMGPGSYQVWWDAQVASGVYFARLQGRRVAATRRILVQR
jgi:hypothetical protein